MPGHIEGALAIARAAIDASEFTKARQALAPFVASPTQRVALLMAEIERTEHRDAGRARTWTLRAVRARHDPAWTADGYVSDRWRPVSPVTGRLDAFQWKVPLAELGGPVEDDIASVLIEAPREVASPPLNGTDPGIREAAAPLRARAQPMRSGPPPIIPLAHVPDDPGPEPEAVLDVEAANEPPPDAWQRIRQLFR
jgi:HemY protein